MTRKGSLYPLDALLSTWTERDWTRTEGIQLGDVAHMQRLIVRTYQHAYEIFVRCGATGDVIIRGGRFFQEFTAATLTGSSMSGAFLKQHGIYVGLRVEINVNGETLMTAPVFSIAVCPMTLAAIA